MVLRLQETEPALALADVVDVVGDLADELAYLMNDCRHEQGPDHRERRQDQHISDRSGEAAPADSVALEELDRRVHRQREEQRDQDPRDHVPRDPDHLEDDGNGDDRTEHGQDRAHGKADEPLGHHAPRIAASSDVHR